MNSSRMKLGVHRQHYGIDLFIFLHSVISLMFLWASTPLCLSQYFSQKAKTLLSLICFTILMTTSVRGPRSTGTEEKIAVAIVPQFPYSLVTMASLVRVNFLPSECFPWSHWCHHLCPKCATMVVSRACSEKEEKQRRDFLLLFMTLGVLFPAFGPIREDSSSSYSHLHPLYTSGFWLFLSMGGMILEEKTWETPASVILHQIVVSFLNIPAITYFSES